MLEKTLRVLEFGKIMERLSTWAISDMGRESIAQLMPACDEGTVRLWQQETEEARTALAYLGHHPIGEFVDVRAPIKLAGVGGTLSPRMLLDVAQTLRVARLARQSLVSEKDHTPHIGALASGLCVMRALEEEIFAAILSEDELSDHASPQLNDIRRNLRKQQDRVRDKLNSIIHSTSMQKHLQDPIITMRGDRHVIPVKLESRAFVPGLVHDQSATGATLFIEPMAVVELNNELKQLAVKEKAEIERILAELSAALAPEATMLMANLDILAHLDLAFAKAMLSRDMRAVEPKLNANGFINLKRARHPLIDPLSVVPLDIHMGDMFTTLVITGPNTGGKTVTLKTVGLFTLMAQAGLHVPAELGTELAVFDQVFADIGDEQSIEQSLSTFSSHMTNIVSILRDVTPGSLALFDELGAGTDPTEGAALAISILENLLKRDIRTLATTHYSELKVYALSTPGIENASVEFDVATLRPTYRLSVGIPGKSNAFEISRKLGLPDEIIAGAAQRLSQEQIRFEDVIANAEYHRQVAQKERALAEEAHRQTQRLRDEVDAQRKLLEEQRDQMMKKAKEDARRVLTRAQHESEEIISQLKRSRKGDADLREHEIQNLKRQLQGSIDDMQDALKTKVERVGEPPRDLKPGDAIDIIHLNTQGVVIRPPDAKQEVVVQAGAMKFTVHITQLRRTEQPTVKKTRPRSETVLMERSGSMECDLRGMTLDEALLNADLFLDTAALQNRSIVSLIHGKGTGVLRSGIQAHLKKHPHVKEYRLGRYGEGEDGVTVVTLK